jgi:hypothetical protein
MLDEELLAATITPERSHLWKLVVFLRLLFLSPPLPSEQIQDEGRLAP